jgi:hypothetical protein
VQAQQQPQAQALPVPPPRQLATPQDAPAGAAAASPQLAGPVVAAESTQSAAVARGPDTQGGASSLLLSSLQAEVGRLRDSNRLLTSSNEQLRHSNEHMLQTMERLQQRLLELTHDYQAAKVRNVGRGLNCRATHLASVQLEKQKLQSQAQALQARLALAEQQLELAQFRTGLATALNASPPPPSPSLARSTAAGELQAARPAAATTPGTAAGALSAARLARKPSLTSQFGQVRSGCVSYSLVLISGCFADSIVARCGSASCAQSDA